MQHAGRKTKIGIMSVLTHGGACPPEDQADVIHAISPISVKLGQIEGHTQ